MSYSRGMMALYSRLARDYDPKHIVKRIPRREAERLKASKEAVIFCRHCGSGNPKLHCSRHDGHEMIAQLVDLRRGTGVSNSQMMISPGEMKANAGLLGPSRTKHLDEQAKLELAKYDKKTEDFVERSEVKVAEYPLWGDNKAVRVPGCHPEEFQRLIARRAKELGYVITASAPAVV